MLAGGALVSAVIAPPLVAFVPRPAPALALAGVAAALLVAPLRAENLRVGARVVGALLAWGVVAWCVLSQVSPLTVPLNLTYSQRLSPLAALVGVWLWLMVERGWLRRVVPALALPSLLGLALVAWTSPPRPLTFRPYYVTVDSTGTVYATDAEAPVIRVFDAGGALRAKLRPGLAARMALPGPGFSRPGPYNDPENLGVGISPGGLGRVTGSLAPWPSGFDDFWFCGLATDARNQLYVPDWMHHTVMRFGPDGQLRARWALPLDYEPSLNCVAAAGDSVLLADSHGALLRLDADGRIAQRWSIPERIIGGVTVATDGSAAYVLARQRIYRIGLDGVGGITSWALPPVRGPLGTPYQNILALAGGRLAVTNLTAHRVELYTDTGVALGALGRPGIWPGEFGQVGGLAHDAKGNLYVADSDSRAIQRFSSSGQVNAIMTAPDDDEVD